MWVFCARRWGGPFTHCQLVFAGGPNNDARCQCTLCWRNHVAVAQRDGGPQCPQICPGRDGSKSLSHSYRLRYTVARPPVKERPLPPPSLPWNSMGRDLFGVLWPGLYRSAARSSGVRRADAPHVEPASWLKSQKSRRREKGQPL